MRKKPDIQIDPKRDVQLKRLATEIAKDIFTPAWSNARASRLVMAFKASPEGPEKQSGGICEACVRDVVLALLRKGAK